MRRAWIAGLLFPFAGCVIHTRPEAPELHAQWTTPVITCDLHRADEHMKELHAHLMMHAWVTGPSEPTDQIVIALPDEQKAIRFPPPASDIVTIRINAPAPIGLRLVIEWQTKDHVVRQRAERVIYAVPCGEDE